MRTGLHEVQHLLPVFQVGVTLGASGIEMREDVTLRRGASTLLQVIQQHLVCNMFSNSHLSSP